MGLFGWEAMGRDNPMPRAAPYGFAAGYLVCRYLVPVIKRKTETGMRQRMKKPDLRLIGHTDSGATACPRDDHQE